MYAMDSNFKSTHDGSFKSDVHLSIVNAALLKTIACGEIYLYTRTPSDVISTNLADMAETETVTERIWRQASGSTSEAKSTVWDWT